MSTTLMDELLSPVQATMLLGMSTARLRQLADAGTVPAISTPNGRLYRKEDILALAREREARRAAREP